MKAIRKADGKEIEVVLLHEEEYIDSASSGEEWKRVYNRDALILDKPADWQSFRREAAKDILCAFASNPVVIDERPDTFEPDFYSEIAVEWADSLIKQLREDKQ